jgi:hypothetical protein
VSLTLTDYAGRELSVEPAAVQAELTALLVAVGDCCGENGTEPHREALRRARSALMKRLDEVTK